MAKKISDLVAATQLGDNDSFVFNDVVAGNDKRVTAAGLRNALDIATNEYVDNKASFLRSFTNVKDPEFGSKGDGVTNDTNSIINALAYVKSIGGGTLYFPNGIYMVDDHIDIPSNVLILGENKELAIIRAIKGTVFQEVSFRDGQNVGILRRRWHRYMLAPETRGYIGLAKNISIKNITIDWNNCPAYDPIADDYASPCPVWIDSVDGVVVSEIAVINALEENPVLNDSPTTYRGTAFSVTQAKNVFVEKSYFGSSHYRSIEVLAEAQNVTFVNCVLETKNPWRHSLEFASYHRQASEGTWIPEKFGPIKFIRNKVIALPGNGQFDVFSAHWGVNVTFEDNEIIIMGAGAVTMRAIKVFDGSQHVSVKRNKIYMLGRYENSDWTGLWASLRAYQLGNDSPDLSCRDIFFDDNHIFIKSQRDQPISTEWCIIQSMNNVDQFNCSVDNNVITIFDMAMQSEKPIISFAATIFSVSNNKFRFDPDFTGTSTGPTIIKIRSHARDGYIGGNVASKNADFRKSIEVEEGTTNIIVSPNNILEGDFAPEWVDADNDIYKIRTGRLNLIDKDSRTQLNLSHETYDGMTGWFIFTSGLLSGTHDDIIVRSAGNILKIHGANSTDRDWFEMLKNNRGFILRSSDGTRYKLSVNNAGELEISPA